MEQQILEPPISRRDPRVVATWMGAAIVLACGMWLYVQGGTAGFHSRAPAAAVSTELTQELGCIDQRLAGEGEAVKATDPERAGRIASLHWDRAARLAQHEYYRQCGTSWTDDR